jgi:hypothetical protein
MTVIFNAQDHPLAPCHLGPGNAPLDIKHVKCRTAVAILWQPRLPAVRWSSAGRAALLPRRSLIFDSGLGLWIAAVAYNLPAAISPLRRKT